MKKICLFMLLICSYFTPGAQTLFWSDTFEDTGAPLSGTRTPSVQNSNGGPPAVKYFFRTAVSGINLQNGTYTGYEGSKIWAAEDIDAALNGTNFGQSSNQNITWTGINITGKTGITFKGLFAANDFGGQIWDGKSHVPNIDFMIVEYRINSGTWTKVLGFFPDNLLSGVLAEDTNADSVGDGTALGYAFKEFTANIPGTGTTLELRFNCFANGGATEELAIDNFRLFEASGSTWNGTSWTPSAPTAAVDAVIASSTAPGNFTCKNLTINSGVALTLSSGTTANVNGNLVNSGNGVNGTGAINFASSGTVSGSAINLSGTLTVGTGAVLTTGGLITLASDATNTGRIGNSSGTISGNVTVRRYIPGKRAFRFLAHPFSSSIAMSSLTDNIDITGSGGSPFTSTNTNNPSAFYFDVNTADNSTTGNNPGWGAFTASGTWARYQGMRVLVRGTKGQGLTAASYTPAAVTLDMSGVVNQGSQVVALAKGSGTSFVLVGNPFPSQIDLNATTSRTNVGSSFYVWDATIGTKGGYTSAPFSSSYILPAYASFVTTLTANGSITFPEICKSSSAANALFKTSTVSNQVDLRIEDSTTFWDRLLVRFDDNALNIVDYEDAAELYNPEVSFYTTSADDSMLSIDSRPYKAQESIKLGLYSPYQKNYKIVAADFNMPVGTKLFLHDKYLQKVEEINQIGYEYWFTVNADSNSMGNSRFELKTEGSLLSLNNKINESGFKLKLVPNPATDHLTLYYDGFNGNSGNVVISSMSGMLLIQMKFEGSGNGNVSLPVQGLASGIYMITMEANGQKITQKFVKQ